MTLTERGGTYAFGAALIGLPILMLVTRLIAG